MRPLSQDLRHRIIAARERGEGSGEHIEFPLHGLGQTIACPHCEMDVTLKEPA